MKKISYEKLKTIISRITLNVFNTNFMIALDKDKIYTRGIYGRYYIQLSYTATCIKTGRQELYKGRKWYLSPYMTEDEVVKTIYLAFEVAVKHEILEGFKMDDTPLFNPHTPYNEILKISKIEKTR